MAVMYLFSLKQIRKKFNDVEWQNVLIVMVIHTNICFISFLISSCYCQKNMTLFFHAIKNANTYRKQKEILFTAICNLLGHAVISE